MNKLVAPIIVSLIVIAFAFIFHSATYNPNDWNAVLIWLPVCIAPIWGLAGWSWWSERGKK